MQHDLFLDNSLDVDLTISFDEIIQDLNISTATIRNWIKAKYLNQIKKGHVSLESYNKFKKDIVGIEKLNKRANKLYVDKVDIDNTKNYFLKKIELKSITQQEEKDLSSIYETSLGQAFRNKEGLYYTPELVIEEMFSNIPAPEAGQTFIDPCCGTGNFLLKALEKGFEPQNIYGFDIDETALEIARYRFFKKTGIETKNIKKNDFLEHVMKKKCNKKYDFIFTNPPWGYKYSKVDKIMYAKYFNNNIKADSSGFFALACLLLLKQNGFLGLLLPESFFNVSSFSSIRKKLLSFEIMNITDHKKPFEGLQTRAQSFILKNATVDKNIIKCNYELEHQREREGFVKNPNFIFNFNISQKDSNLIDHLYSIPHSTLKNNVSWGLGIVTGNNKKFIKNKILENYIPVYKGLDIVKNKINKPSNFIPKDLTLYQQVAPKNLYEAKEKLVYRFISSDLVFAYDNQQRFFLNSANVIIPDEKSLGINCEQLNFLMNSKIINWIFKSIFRTHKILRSDLEKLPIYTDFFRDNINYNESDLYNYLKIEEKKDGTFRVKK